LTGQSEPAGRGALTPAVVAAALFAVLAAAISISFVVSRGGLVLPVAATRSGDVAAVSPAPASAVTTPTAASTPSPIATVAPSDVPTPTPVSTPKPSTRPSAAPGPFPTLAPGDPLIGLPACPDHPGCYIYTVRRGDTFSGVSDRFGLLLWVTAALNPEVTDQGQILVGQPLYLGHDPMARLELCRDGSCRQYVVRAGDSVSAIAARFHLSTAAVQAANPGLGTIRVGDVVRLPISG
jgi:nucleoid-associated protein YgaU